MNRDADLFLEFVTPRPLTSEEEGRELLDLVDEHVPEWFPRTYGHSEPARTPFDRERLEEVWRGRGLLWKGANGEDAQVWMRVYPDQAHSTLSVDGFHAVSGGQRPAALLRAAAEHLRADWGFVHHVSESELTRPRPPKSMRRSAEGTTLFWPSHRLKEYLPDLYWANILGPPYAALFGREHILSAPVHRVEEVASATFYLQLTERIEELEERHDELERVREAAKRHLGENAFWNPAASEEHEYDTPRFEPAGASR